MPKILCFGNEHFPGDEIAKALARKIKKYKEWEFVIAESPHEILRVEGDLWILDVIKGLKTVTLLENPEKLELSKSLTGHDLDLGFYLKLLTETGKIKNTHIIGLPWGEHDLEKLKKAVLSRLTSLMS
jgi:Ni,Fe-hydrogenase maturation factor